MTGNGSVQREYPSTVKRAAITLLGSGWEHTDLNTLAVRAVRRGSVAHHELISVNRSCDPCDGLI